MLKRYIGDRQFYRHLLSIAVPIIIQGAITTFVSMIDNIMVGQMGTLEMSGVSIANQVIQIFYSTLGGMLGGAGIFTAQYAGAQNNDGIRYTFRVKLIFGTALLVFGLAVYSFFGEALILRYLTGEGSPENAAKTLEYGLSYMKIMMIGLAHYMLSQAYALTLREAGQTRVPMIAAVAAVLTNTCLNYVLIFGRFGAPQLGVRGAAIATVISRFVELVIAAGWSHLNPEKAPFIRGVYRSASIPGYLTKDIILKGMPLMLNEFVWVTGTVLVTQSYSLRGLDVVPAINIAATLANLTNVVACSIGMSMGIIIGQVLGRGATEEEVWDQSRKLIFATEVFAFIFMGITAMLSGIFPGFYNVSEEVKRLASAMILINAVIVPFNGLVSCLYCTLRAGGQSMANFVMDCGAIWLVTVPLAVGLSRFTNLPIIALYAICQLADTVKVALGFWMLRKGKWIRNLAKRETERS